MASLSSSARKVTCPCLLMLSYYCLHLLCDTVEHFRFPLPKNLAEIASILQHSRITSDGEYRSLLVRLSFTTFARCKLDRFHSLILCSFLAFFHQFISVHTQLHAPWTILEQNVCTCRTETLTMCHFLYTDFLSDHWCIRFEDQRAFSMGLPLAVESVDDSHNEGSRTKKAPHHDFFFYSFVLTSALIAIELNLQWKFGEDLQSKARLICKTCVQKKKRAVMQTKKKSKRTSTRASRVSMATRGAGKASRPRGQRYGPVTKLHRAEENWKAVCMLQLRDRVEPQCPWKDKKKKEMCKSEINLY